MIFSLDVQRARKGDCLILHYGTKDEPGLVLIDGGPSQVYKPFLRPRLAQIRKARGLAEDKSLVVDLLMVSHIDDDHINGILELTEELVTAVDARRPLPFKIRQLWHNSFDAMIGDSSKELLSAVTASFGAAAITGDLDNEDLDPDTAKVLASVGQGLRLSSDAKKLEKVGLSINHGFTLKLISEENGRSVNLDKGMKFIVAGPMTAELLALRKDYSDFLERQTAKGRPTLASFTDKSVANLSSIVLLAEVDKKRMLLTGDARGDKILEGLEKVKLMSSDGKLHVDILKVPHHGSDRNVALSFFERITADHYVISGNGEHGNPERETLKMILDARDNSDFSLHLTYPVAEIDSQRKLQRQRARQKWSDQKDSLANLFAGNKAFTKKLRVVAADKPCVIDLHEHLGY